jgi:GTP-binding protein EngB required for normal cell division
MQDFLGDLREKLDRARMILEKGEFLSFTSEERQQLADEVKKLQGRLDALSEGSLTVGLLGGTGVGKSTLMNALAGAEIASTSHRRPHTDQVLIYRHEATVLPAALQGGLAVASRGEAQEASDHFWHELTHRAEPIRQILLCDLPDFDSLAGEHGRRVLRFLEHLDVLVWVTSPEKYADERFYSFLREAPKARANFFFVLNKIDIFFDGPTVETGYAQLGKVGAGFQQHLAQNGIEGPLLYCLSALDAQRSQSPAPWNQFASFRSQVFRNRDMKEVVAVKSANLDVEVIEVLSKLEREIENLQGLQGTLREFISELEGERVQWREAAERTLEPWLETHLDSAAFSQLADPSPLVGAGYLIAIAAQELRRRVRSTETQALVGGLFLDRDRLEPMRRELERVENRLAHRLLRKGLPASILGELGKLVDPERNWEGLIERFRRSVELQLGHAEPVAPRGFGLRQYGIYTIILLCFLLALGGEEGWRHLLTDPSLSNFLGLVVGMVAVVFSPVGLAALGSFFLLQLFFGFRFYGRYKKFLQQRRQKFIESVGLNLRGIWQEELDSVMSRFAEYAEQLAAQSSAISLISRTSDKE